MPSGPSETVQPPGSEERKMAARSAGRAPTTDTLGPRGGDDNTQAFAADGSALGSNTGVVIWSSFSSAW